MTPEVGLPILLPAPRQIQSVVNRSCSLLPPQGYRISSTTNRIEITAADPAGKFYALQTFGQLRRQYGDFLPTFEIEDWPDFPVRGVMLDISRDKVPTMQTLFDLIDLVASWKINQIQLYTEHTFAYRGHEEVWKNASPMTPQEIRILDQFCQERFIELVPNQNSFGHMERWLKHPQYLPLAESPQGAETPWGYRWNGPFSFCPTDPGSLALLDDLYSQLLPNFSSKLFNAGCDETFDIGQGRSKSECESRGVTRVYLDFLNRVNSLVAKHGRRMMFWGDIILHHPELIRELPPDCIALNWGYEADHPFESEAKLFADSGVAFYVCPGTSSWCSITGRIENMLENQRNAAAAGLRHGAAGYLNTDWGDYGHLQYLPFSYPGFAAGAAMSWCLETNRDLPLADALDLHAFRDSAGIMGRAACDLGNVYRALSHQPKNRSALFNILVPSASRKDPMIGVTPDDLNAAEAAIDSAMKGLDVAKMDRTDANLILDEFRNAAAMLKYACRLGKGETSNFSQELQTIRETHSRSWLARNRPGGLSDSVERLSKWPL